MTSSSTSSRGTLEGHDGGARRPPRSSGRGVYREVSKPYRLVMDLSDQAGDEYERYTATFTAHGNKTEMVLSQTGGHLTDEEYDTLGSAPTRSWTAWRDACRACSRRGTTPTEIALTRRSLLRATRELAAADPQLGASVERFGAPPLWASEPSYATLVHLILEQQVSLASAQAAFDRLRGALGDVTPAGVLAPQRRGDASHRVQPPEDRLRARSGACARRRVRSRHAAGPDGRRGARRAHRSPRHRPVDRRHLPDDVSASTRYLAAGRPGPPHGGCRAHRLRQTERPRARRARRGMAAVSRGRRADPLARLPAAPRPSRRLSGRVCSARLRGRPRRRPWRRRDRG